MQENEIPRDRLAGLRRIPLSWVFFPLALLYHELLLRAFDPASVFFDGALLPIALAAIGGGLLLSLLCGLSAPPARYGGAGRWPAPAGAWPAG